MGFADESDNKYHKKNRRPAKKVHKEFDDDDLSDDTEHTDWESMSLKEQYKREFGREAEEHMKR